MREAAKWLQAAFDGGRPFAKLHLAHLTFYAGQEDAALAHFKEHLSWCVQRGRETCAGCGQTRGEDTPMLTCSGCLVARFCSADHQKMASKKAALGRSLKTGRHKDICGVLRKWREAVKDGVAPDSCNAEIVAFLQRGNARCPRTQRERQRQSSHEGGPGRRPADGLRADAPGVEFEFLVQPDQKVTLALSLGTLGNAPTASMPAAARLHCILDARDLRMLALVFGLCSPDVWVVFRKY